jgi:hypothetical protein
VERSGTLGISYPLRSALKERHRSPAKKRAVCHCPILQLLQSWTFFVLLPRVPLRFTLGWAVIDGNSKEPSGVRLCVLLPFGEGAQGSIPGQTSCYSANISKLLSRRHPRALEP